jgi:hypothetical protein
MNAPQLGLGMNLGGVPLGALAAGPSMPDTDEERRSRVRPVMRGNARAADVRGRP